MTPPNIKDHLFFVSSGKPSEVSQQKKKNLQQKNSFAKKKPTLRQ